MRHLNIFNVLLSLILIFPLTSEYTSLLNAQIQPDSLLLKEIFKIWAIDNHSHVFPFNQEIINQSEPKDALGTAPFPYPVRLRVDNPEYIKAWHSLYNYSYSDMDSGHTKDALHNKYLLMREKREDWPVWILDQVRIQTAFVNLPKLGPGQKNKRFRLVPLADVLMIPFRVSNDTVSLKKGIRQILTELKMDSLPENLTNYTSQVVTPILKKWKDEGAIAIKIAVAYQRPLNFADVNENEVNDVYTALLRNEMVSASKYKALQDYLFRYLAFESGHIGFAVHIHTGIGADPYFDISGSNPMLLEPVLNDPIMRQTAFVLIHGGWPFEKQGGILTIKPNVYIDFSAQTFLRSTRVLSETLREWLEWYPEKVLFGTDAYSDPNTPLSDWEEKIWLSNYNSRTALAIALSGMMKDDEITEERALEIARMVLRENAIKLYKLDGN